MKKIFFLLLSFIFLYEKYICNSAPKAGDGAAAKVAAKDVRPKEYYDRLLKVAAGIGDIQRVDEALDNGADEILIALEEAAKNNNPNRIIEHILQKRNLNANSLIFPPDSFFKTESDYDSMEAKENKKLCLLYKDELKADRKSYIRLLRLAIQMRYDSLVLYLIRNFPVDLDQATYGTTLLTLATEYNNIEVVRELLLKNRKIIDATDNDDDSALQIAVKLGFNNIVELLLQAGANPKLVNRRALHDTTEEIRSRILQARQYKRLREQFEQEESQQRAEGVRIANQEQEEIYKQARMELRGIKEKERRFNEFYREESEARKRLEQSQKEELNDIKQDVLVDLEPVDVSTVEDSFESFFGAGQGAVGSSDPVQAKSASPKAKQKAQAKRVMTLNDIKRELSGIKKVVLPANQRLPIFLGFQNVVVDLDHVFNLGSREESSSFVFTGGHYEPVIQSLLLREDLVSLIRIQHLNENGIFIDGQGRQEDFKRYFLKNLHSGTFFTKTTFPVEWTPEYVMNILNGSGNIGETERRRMDHHTLGIKALLLHKIPVFIVLKKKNDCVYLVTLMPVSNDFVINSKI